MPLEYGERKGRGEKEAGRTCEHGHFRGAAERMFGPVREELWGKYLQMF